MLSRLWQVSCDVSIPADVECELLSAGFDPVLSLHVCHQLRAVAVDCQDGVAWTQVTLGRLAAWCNLSIYTHTHTHTHTHIHTHSDPSTVKRRKDRAVRSCVQLSVRDKDRKKERV